ncbi:MAG: AarF/ABC1/UbiB kinase family protein [Vampirovibrio sp.]|jgi:predicted unusual protein kinase regulating ubiquinone biosynthesis (AarF/ABC1/UbiB family)|nr:AarF/ABC1/UbiB kinase family protein [Vampirovibrio sp.]
MISELKSPPKPRAEQVLIASSSTLRPPARPSLRFGASDSNTTTAALPSWTKQVKDPPISLPMLMDEALAFEKRLSGPNPPGFFAKIWQGLKLARSGRKLYRELAEESRYLPTAAQKELTRYHRTPGYWWSRLVNPAHARLMDVVYQGPMAIKAKQQAVSLLPLIRDSMNMMETEAKKQTGLLKFFLQFPARLFNKQIRRLEAYAPLLNQVPALPYAQFEKQLNSLKADYNKSHTKDPITNIEKEPIGTGSMGQVYRATTQHGTKLVMKVIRPNLNEAFLNEYLPYSYYRILLVKGTSPQAKHQAVQNAQNTVDLLKAEIHPEQEAANIRHMKQWADKLQPKAFQIPEVLTASKSGFIMPYVGEKDLADVSPVEQTAFKNKLAPELARFLLLASAKPLDLHNGNIRIGQPAAWIDHGRQINLTEQNHEALLHLMLAAYKAPKSHPALSIWENALLQPEVRTRMKSLLEISPEANRQALQKLAGLEKADKLSDDVIHQAELKEQLNKTRLIEMISPNAQESAAEKKLKQQIDEVGQKIQTFNETKVLLTQLLGQPNISTPKAPLPFTRSLPKPEVQPSVLYAWASSAMNLPGFSPSKLPQSDTAQYRHKSHGFLVPSLQASSQAETDKKLQTLSDELAEALLSQCKITANQPEKAALTEVMKTALKRDLPVKISTDKESPLPK